MTALKFTPRPANSALRGNMDRCLVHARNGKSKIKLSRREVIAKVREERFKPQIHLLVQAARDQYKLKTGRIASLRVLRNGGFHVTGLGNLPQLTLGELRVRLGMENFTGFRFASKRSQKLFR